MKKATRLVAAALAMTLAGGSAHATVYDWSFTDSSDTVVASGTLTTGSPVVIAGVGTVDPVLSASGSLFNVDGFSSESLTLYGTYVAPLGYNTIGNQTYDNAIYVTVPALDGNGLEFVGGTYGDYVNIYNNVNTGGYSPGNDPNQDVIWNANVSVGGGTFTVAVPELSTWAMMLAGFAGLGFAGYRRTKSDRAALAS